MSVLQIEFLFTQYCRNTAATQTNEKNAVNTCVL